MDEVIEKQDVTRMELVAARFGLDDELVLAYAREGGPKLSNCAPFVGAA